MFPDLITHSCHSQNGHADLKLHQFPKSSKIMANSTNFKLTVLKVLKCEL